MATEEQRKQRLFVVDEKVVVMEGEEIIEFLQIEENKIKEEILQQIKQKKSIGQNIEPMLVFTDALKEITGIPFKQRGYKMKITNLSIHESPLYRRFLKFICNEMNFKKRNEEQKIANIIKRKEKEKDVYYDWKMANIAQFMAYDAKRRRK